MKTRLVVLAVLVSMLILSACATPPPAPTRQDQLSDTGLFGKHPLQGVTIENGLEGEMSGGFFLFAAGINGQISSTTKYIFTWYPTPGKYITTEIPRSLIVVNVVENQVQPEFELIFKTSWLSDFPYTYIDDAEVVRNEYNYTLYSDGAKLNLNNFIKPENLDIVYVYVSPQDLLPPSK
ncbi:MAG: hypothetical protein UX08_C0013G0012 [Candidatus Collierbacteria bacterium GW2011_GWB1_45_35]|uniref:Lipoprotein n=2 Tax=Candidatus Collieribacteriota TaxID=1752725 RepID=A0A0G1MXB4_9BACT|nr:MAG: hypothetical protein UW48_C0008G0012 [Microgenomates group bacterium GW2011_GWC1_44_23]KKT85417.1 MAG: hypothetical protein UW84_C0032G0004 [Candidatus Collierbacteria bacterium GW2011_GWA2_44_99]KKT95345.1 MAG: hypothetical protein UW96_C0008G0012 [Candidatus Collierbacteria bacterium GW2011_GWA1_45_15]KKT99605.1 MAG: hypothetical protein UX01_C0009G0035 [Candidatus Collierbacteria bacterium GW2011_GWB2_45_17]KKU04922.1 MAG: hypothetical protein UX08_C0013G0012 [Candidatus Collierbacte